MLKASRSLGFRVWTFELKSVGLLANASLREPIDGRIENDDILLWVALQL